MCSTLKSFEFSSNTSATSLFNPQKYLDAAQEMFTFQPNEESGNMDSIADGYDSDDDLGEGGDGFERDTGFGRLSNLPDDNAIPVILSEMEATNNGGDFENESGGGDSEDMFSYFDQSLQKRWMGPEHWRARVFRGK